MGQTKIHESVFLADGARVIGDVSIGEKSSVWYNAVIRGDRNSIVIGEQTNIQDGAVLHVDEEFPLKIGNGVVVGHRAILHGCTVGDDTLIGMGAIVLNGARIGKNCVIGAGALVTGKQEIPDGMVALGSPSRIIRAATEAELRETKESAAHYLKEAQEQKKNQQ